MKIIIFNIFIFTLVYVNTNSQTLEPLLDTTKQWTDLGFSSAKDIKPGLSIKYKLSGEIFIDSLKYYMLYISMRDPDFETWILYRYIRETTDGKVYLMKLNQTQEILLYDFNLNSGDSIAYQGDNGIIADSVSFHEFAGKTRKYIYCHPYPSYYPEVIRLVEGIGAIDYGFLNILNIGLIGGEWNFLCFEQNGELLYHNQINSGEGIIEGCYYDEDGYPWDPILNTEKRWTDLNLTDTKYSLQGQSATYKLGNIVYLNGKYYYILYQSLDSLNQTWNYPGFIRNYSNKKVYYMKPGVPNEFLLYDYSVNINDSLNYGGNGIVITSRAFLIYANRYRWHWYGHTFPQNRPDTIIEGIGSISSGFLGVLNAGLDTQESHLLCFKENDQLLYHYPVSIPGYGTIEGCYFNNTDIEPISKDEIFQIIPNPVESKGRIKTEENLKFPVILEVFTLSGVKAHEVKIQKAEQEISFSTLAPGIYMCRIRLNDKVLISKVVIK